MKVIVLGSGIIGTSTAWWLRQAGHEVTVVDRQPGPAQETSFANGCQISTSYAEPWAMPETPAKMARWMVRDDAPLLFRPRADLRQWTWGLSFLRECLPARLRRNVRPMVNMAVYSRATLRELRASLGIEYEHLEKGIITFYRDQTEFAESHKVADLMREFGVNRQAMSVDELVAVEPALAASAQGIVGGDYTADDESGNVYLFTTALARHAAQAGVEFRFSTQITRLVAERGWVKAVEVIGSDGRYARLDADVFVAALGSFTPDIVGPLGVPCMVYPAKGYSATYTVTDSAKAPSVSLTDNGNKVVFSRLGDRLRVAGTAEFSGYSRALNPTRCELLTRITGEMFPGAVDLESVSYWSGLRPATPSNVPLIGRTRLPNLYLNTGHGTLGWTMGCGSGRALADLICGHRPQVDFPFL
jgi:D-amino-acid dehydrogenase